MAEKRKDITQAMCNHVKLLIKGGATNKTAGELIGVSATTISRIRTAGYSAEEFRKNNEARREEEKLLAAPIRESAVNAYFARREEEKKTGSYACAYTGGIEDKSGLVLTTEGPITREELRAAAREFQDAANQVPGQLAMDLPESDLPQEVREKLQGLMEEVILTAQVREITEKIEESQLKTRKVIYAGVDRITAKLDKLNDNLCQILRRMDK